VWVDGERDVAGVGAEFYGQRHLADQLTGERPDDRRADDPLAVLVEQELGHALLPGEGERAAARRPGEDAFAVLGAGRPRLLLGHPDPGDLGIGVGDRRDDPRLEEPGQPAGHLGRDVPLVHGLVGEHRLAHHVTDGEDVRHGGALLLVHRDEPALVDPDAGALGADAPAVGLAADRHEQLVEDAVGGSVGAVEGHPQPGRLGFDVGHLGLQVDAAEALRDPLGQRRDDVLVDAGDQLVQQLDDGHLGTELGVDGSHLQADDAAADDQQPLWDPFGLQRTGRVDHPRVVVGDERERRRLRPAGHDRLLEADRGPGAVLADHFEQVGRGEAALPGHDRHLALLGQASQAAGEPADHRVLPGEQFVQVDGWLAERQPVLGHLPRLGDDLRGVQQRLGRDAADVEADPAQGRAAVDEHHAAAEVGRAERGAVAARAGAEHEHLGVQLAPLLARDADLGRHAHRASLLAP
jgi:hypothetical protein